MAGERGSCRSPAADWCLLPEDSRGVNLVSFQFFAAFVPGVGLLVGTPDMLNFTIGNDTVGTAAGKPAYSE